MVCVEPVISGFFDFASWRPRCKTWSSTSFHWKNTTSIYVPEYISRSSNSFGPIPINLYFPTCKKAFCIGRYHINWPTPSKMSTCINEPLPWRCTFRRHKVFPPFPKTQFGVSPCARQWIVGAISEIPGRDENWNSRLGGAETVIKISQLMLEGAIEISQPSRDSSRDKREVAIHRVASDCPAVIWQLGYKIQA